MMYQTEPMHGRTKHILVWENGDFLADEHPISINPKYFRTWNGVLSIITDTLKPSFGAVRNLIKLDSKELVDSFEKLEPNGRYVATGHEKIRFSRNGNCYLTASERQNLKETQPIMVLGCNSTLTSMRRGNKTIIFVMANGKTCEIPCKVVLTESDLNSWDTILNYIAKSLDIPEGIPYLTTINGERVYDPRELQNGWIYVAAPYNQKFVPLDYMKVFHQLLPMREITSQGVFCTSHPEDALSQINAPGPSNYLQNNRNVIEVNKSKSEGTTSVKVCRNRSSCVARKASALSREFQSTPSKVYQEMDLQTEMFELQDSKSNGNFNTNNNNEHREIRNSETTTKLYSPAVTITVAKGGVQGELETEIRKVARNQDNKKTSSENSCCKSECKIIFVPFASPPIPKETQNVEVLAKLDNTATKSINTKSSDTEATYKLANILSVTEPSQKESICSQFEKNSNSCCKNIKEIIKQKEKLHCCSSIKQILEKIMTEKHKDRITNKSQTSSQSIIKEPTEHAKEALVIEDTKPVEGVIIKDQSATSKTGKSKALPVDRRLLPKQIPSIKVSELDYDKTSKTIKVENIIKTDNISSSKSSSLSKAKKSYRKAPKIQQTTQTDQIRPKSPKSKKHKSSTKKKNNDYSKTHHKEQDSDNKKPDLGQRIPKATSALAENSPGAQDNTLKIVSCPSSCDNSKRSKSPSPKKKSGLNKPLPSPSPAVPLHANALAQTQVLSKTNLSRDMTITRSSSKPIPSCCVNEKDEENSFLHKSIISALKDFSEYYPKNSIFKDIPYYNNPTNPKQESRDPLLMRSKSRSKSNSATNQSVTLTNKSTSVLSDDLNFIENISVDSGLTSGLERKSSVGSLSPNKMEDLSNELSVSMPKISIDAGNGTQDSLLYSKNKSVSTQSESLAEKSLSVTSENKDSVQKMCSTISPKEIAVVSNVIVKSEKDNSSESIDNLLQSKSLSEKSHEQSNHITVPVSKISSDNNKACLVLNPELEFQAETKITLNVAVSTNNNKISSLQSKAIQVVCKEECCAVKPSTNTKEIDTNGQDMSYVKATTKNDVRSLENKMKFAINSKHMEDKTLLDSCLDNTPIQTDMDKEKSFDKITQSEVNSSNHNVNNNPASPQFSLNKSLQSSCKNQFSSQISFDKQIIKNERDGSKHKVRNSVKVIQDSKEKESKSCCGEKAGSQISLDISKQKPGASSPQQNTLDLYNTDILELYANLESDVQKDIGLSNITESCCIENQYDFKSTKPEVDHAMEKVIKSLKYIDKLENIIEEDDKIVEQIQKLDEKNLEKNNKIWAMKLLNEVPYYQTALVFNVETNNNESNINTSSKERNINNNNEDLTSSHSEVTDKPIDFDKLTRIFGNRSRASGSGYAFLRNKSCPKRRFSIENDSNEDILLKRAISIAFDENRTEIPPSETHLSTLNSLPSSNNSSAKGYIKINRKDTNRNGAENDFRRGISSSDGAVRRSCLKKSLLNDPDLDVVMAKAERSISFNAISSVENDKVYKEEKDLSAATNAPKRTSIDIGEATPLRKSSSIKAEYIVRPNSCLPQIKELIYKMLDILHKNKNELDSDPQFRDIIIKFIKNLLAILEINFEFLDKLKPDSDMGYFITGARSNPLFVERGPTTLAILKELFEHGISSNSDIKKIKEDLKEFDSKTTEKGKSGEAFAQLLGDVFKVAAESPRTTPDYLDDSLAYINPINQSDMLADRDVRQSMCAFLSEYIFEDTSDSEFSIWRYLPRAFYEYIVGEVLPQLKPHLPNLQEKFKYQILKCLDTHVKNFPEQKNLIQRYVNDPKFNATLQTIISNFIVKTLESQRLIDRVTNCGKIIDAHILEENKNLDPCLADLLNHVLDGILHAKQTLNKSSSSFCVSVLTDFFKICEEDLNFTLLLEELNIRNNDIEQDFLYLLDDFYAMLEVDEYYIQNVLMDFLEDLILEIRFTRQNPYYGQYFKSAFEELISGLNKISVLSTPNGRKQLKEFVDEIIEAAIVVVKLIKGEELGDNFSNKNNRELLESLRETQISSEYSDSNEFPIVISGISEWSLLPDDYDVLSPGSSRDSKFNEETASKVKVLHEIPFHGTQIAQEEYATEINVHEKDVPESTVYTKVQDNANEDTAFLSQVPKDKSILNENFKVRKDVIRASAPSKTPTKSQPDKNESYFCVDLYKNINNVCVKKMENEHCLSSKYLPEIAISQLDTTDSNTLLDDDNAFKTLDEKEKLKNTPQIIANITNKEYNNQCLDTCCKCVTGSSVERDNDTIISEKKLKDSCTNTAPKKALTVTSNTSASDLVDKGTACKKLRTETACVDQLRLHVKLKKACFRNLVSRGTNCKQKKSTKCTSTCFEKQSKCFTIRKISKATSISASFTNIYPCVNVMTESTFLNQLALKESEINNQLLDNTQTLPDFVICSKSSDDQQYVDTSKVARWSQVNEDLRAESSILNFVKEVGRTLLPNNYKEGSGASASSERDKVELCYSTENFGMTFKLPQDYALALSLTKSKEKQGNYPVNSNTLE